MDHYLSNDFLQPTRLRPDNPNAPLLKALGNDWHADCFRCVECGLVLDPEEGGYVDKDGAVTQECTWMR